MSKFKVGDSVIGNARANLHYCVTGTGYKGVVTGIRGCNIILNGYWDVKPEYFDLVEPAKPDRHELHITSDGVTTNAVYKLNGKVEKTAKAVCCPSDTFDFNTGAELAINRVLYGTDYGKNDVKEPVCAESAPKQDEPIMLYCVKDYEKWLTKGKTYTFDSNGKIVFDNGWDNSIINRGETLEAFRKRNPNMSACLIRAEKRPAKKDEYILIVNEGLHGPKLRIGDIHKVERVGTRDHITTDKTNTFYGKENSEYLVLPDYVPEKVEPEYYNGKVVCVKSGTSFVAGKVYEFVNGKVKDEDGHERPQPMSPNGRVSDLEQFYCKCSDCAKFIPYLGEQS